MVLYGSEPWQMKTFTPQGQIFKKLVYHHLMTQMIKTYALSHSIRLQLRDFIFKSQNIFFLYYFQLISPWLQRTSSSQLCWSSVQEFCIIYAWAYDPSAPVSFFSVAPVPLPPLGSQGPVEPSPSKASCVPSIRCLYMAFNVSQTTCLIFAFFPSTLSFQPPLLHSPRSHCRWLGGAWWYDFCW